MSTYKALRSATAIVAAILLLQACIHNDIPYPRIQAGFSSIECEHSLQPASLDSINRRITFFLTEEADPQNVVVTRYTLSPTGAQWADSAAFTTGIDLTNPRTTSVALYQDYDWTISAQQTIERRFTVDGQIGAPTIDVPGHRVVAYVPDHADLKALKVTDLKLAGPNATYQPDLIGQTADFTQPLAIKVTEHSRITTWTIYIQTTESNVDITSVDPWTSVAWVYASAQEGRNNRFHYRPEGQTEWIDVPETWVTHSGGTFTARLVHLDPSSNYQVQALSDDDTSAIIDFTTFDTYTIPNSSFDNWWLNGKVWCPWPENGQQYWDTGNRGATTLGSSNTYPVEETPTGTGQAACLETRFVGIGVAGKLAAGNLFAGEYLRTEGTNGVLSFGRPFTLHPTTLTGYFRYKTAPISDTNSDFTHLKGQPDTCIVWVALIDSPQPFEIRTNPKNRNLFNPDAPDVIAYGKVEYGYDVDNWQPFTVNLDYRDTHRTPAYILIVASASKYGDYFTGGRGATLWLDNFQLNFDY